MTTRIAGHTSINPLSQSEGAAEFDTPRTNVCAIVALLSALLLLAVPAFVFGIIGMRQSARRGEDGWGMAFAGAMIGGIELIVGLTLLTLAAVSLSRGYGIAVQW